MAALRPDDATLAWDAAFRAIAGNFGGASAGFFIDRRACGERLWLLPDDGRLGHFGKTGGTRAVESGSIGDRYRAVEEHGAFYQFDCAHAKTGRLDLMLVNNSTFAKLQERARQVQYLGNEIPVVAVEHLIALKLHALKQELPHRAIKDFLDVVELIRANHLDLNSAEMQEIFARYATPDLARRVRIACE